MLDGYFKNQLKESAVPGKLKFRCALVAVLMASLGASAADVARGYVFHDENGNGVFDDAEPGIEGVHVSNGREVVATDAGGQYALPISDDTILFVIKPSGWSTELDVDWISQGYHAHKPAGSPKTKYPGVAPTGPLPTSVDFPLVRHHEPEQFDVLIFGDPQPEDEEGVEHYAHDVIEELVGSDAMFGISLGDIVEDRLDLLDDINDVTAQVGVPWHYVMGNHDMNKDSPSDVLADETFERVYGPPYYSFTYGKMHVIVLDSVYREGDHFHGELGERQLAFIQNDLAHVPDDYLLVFAMHIPLVELSDKKVLFDIVQKRSHLLMIAGHRHVIEQLFLGPDDGWQGATPLHLYVAGASGGSWWTGFRDASGIPHATMSDGSPNGYTVLSVDGNEYSFRYKAARRPEDYQMTITAPEKVVAAQAAATEIVANVFAASERATVEMRFGENGSWTAMTRQRGVDPFVESFHEREKAIAPEEAPWGNPTETNHLWTGALPANPPVGMAVLYVRVVDRFGAAFTGRRLISIE
jgi:hypothetical protein